MKQQVKARAADLVLHCFAQLKLHLSRYQTKVYYMNKVVTYVRRKIRICTHLYLYSLNISHKVNESSWPLVSYFLSFFPSSVVSDSKFSVVPCFDVPPSGQFIFCYIQWPIQLASLLTLLCKLSQLYLYTLYNWQKKTLFVNTYT